MLISKDDKYNKETSNLYWLELVMNNYLMKTLYTLLHS